MSENWRFSPCNEPLVQACVDLAATQEDPNSKWILLREIIGNQDCTNSNTDDGLTIDNSKLDLTLLDSRLVIRDSTADTPIPMDIVKNYSQIEQLMELIEAEPVVHFEELAKETINNTSFSLKLAENLSSSSIEKLCKHVFTQKSLDSSFIICFYTDFFPAYLKKEYSWFSLDLIIKASRAHPEQFEYLLYRLLHDTDIQAKILQDYVLSLNDSKKKDFMKLIMDIGLTNEPFQRHLFSIYTVYKDCYLNEDIQSFLLGNLLKTSNDCASDKHYGRLLLEFIRKENSPGHETEYLNVLGKLVDMHRSPFKRACESLLLEMNNRIEDQNVGHYSQWIIPRPDD